jgi:heat-inducible transcriptional repressor
VEDNRPVGSKTLSEKYDVGLSPASIRMVFKELEDLGYLASLHTSGGRVPTERGYRFYVDSLVGLYELTLIERQRIQEEYLKKQFKLDQILKATSKVLASLTSSAGVVIGPEKNLDTLKHIELIHVNGGELLMIIVMRSGTVVHRNIFVSEHLSQENLYQISRYLNSNIKGFDISEIQERIIPQLLMSLDSPESFKKIGDAIAMAFQLDSKDDDNIYIDGLKNISDGFKDDEERLHSIMALLEEKSMLKEFFQEYTNQDGIYTIIGKDGDNNLGGVSIIATSYRMGEKRIGSLGIIGPQRMRYNRALPLVEFTSKLVSEMITKMSR